LGQVIQRRRLRALNLAPGTGPRAASSQRHEMTSGLHSGVRGHVGDQVVERFGSRADPQPDLVVVKAFHDASFVIGLTSST
jgi:hypothetical protein